ncbi:unnamed protein product [Cuscuta campestris]|uniref:Uncharacterized protein n=1 Tax=Cuscuta campestris TaxID=132261 RepID=A0A484KYU5_9ASTE|nr:unnamed protein product [Cuscuta campestris]
MVKEAVAHSVLDENDACDLEGSKDESHVGDDVNNVFESMNEDDGKSSIVEAIDGDPKHEGVVMFTS